ncbi:MAG: DUF5115 domain-containing protein [Bacteroidales bacterium]|nr:DUF5115 domain-containing protein [Candidatus Liminaster caballi]
MKKSLYFALAAGFLFAACDEDFTNWAEPQGSTEAGATTIDGAVTAGAAIDAATADGDVVLLNLSAPEGCTINASHVYINGDNEIKFNIEDGKLSVSAATLAKTVQDEYQSLAATTRDLEVSGKFAVVNALGEASPLAVAPVTVQYTTPALPANASESAYYYVGGYNGWNLAEPTPFVSKGNGVYELTIQINDGEWFAFAPQSAVDAQDWNALFRAPSNGCTDTFGYLNNDPTTGWSFNCETGGQYTFILDMVNYTFKYIHYIEKEYYYIGALATDKSYPLSNGGADPLENPVFTVTVPAAGGWHWFKIAPGSGFNEDGTWNWDNEINCACAVNKDDEAMEGKFVIGGDKNSWHILEDVYPAMFYRLSFNFLTQEYSITPVNYTEFIYYAGDWTSWGDNKKELALVDSDNGLYNGYYFIKAVDNASTWGFKFIDADGNWYGGGDGVIDAAGGNCDPGQEGFYKISVNWATMTYELTLIETVSIIGDATGDSSWGTDIDLTWDGECWTYTGHLEAGNFKFRANHDWNGMNWGGDKSNLEVDGANASIEAAGDYTVKLYCNCPGKAYYTIE